MVCKGGWAVHFTAWKRETSTVNNAKQKKQVHPSHKTDTGIPGNQLCVWFCFLKQTDVH